MDKTEHDKTKQRLDKSKLDNSKDKTRQNLISEFCNLHKAARDKGIGYQTIQNIFLDRQVSSDQNSNLSKIPEVRKNYKIGWKIKIAIFVAVIAILCGAFLVMYEIQNLEDLNTFIFHESPCAISNNGFVMEISRPLMNCEACRDLRQVPIEENISKELFMEKYAYTGVPVLVKNATKSWTAMSNFSYHFFKDIYTNTKGALESVEEECQFFPYKTEFETLSDLFNISDARANFSEGEKPWYIGWSNCHRKIAKKLRQHYQRPYFLPNDSESSNLDWIFMGGFGSGAFIHIDYVQRPSWQAQISGRKSWSLIPAPECESVCHAMNITLEKGDIFVVDTNQWYHATYIHPGEVCISIGSEYD